MGTRFQGPEDEVRSLNTFIALMRAAQSVSASLARDRAFGNLTRYQLGVLEALYHLGSLSQTELAGKILKSTGNMVTIINNLQKQGLVIRARLKTDRRVVKVVLTEKGRQAVEEVLPHHVRTITKAMSVLSDEEQDELRKLCRTLGLRQAKED